MPEPPLYACLPPDLSDADAADLALNALQALDHIGELALGDVHADNHRYPWGYLQLCLREPIW